MQVWKTCIIGNYCYRSVSVDYFVIGTFVCDDSSIIGHSGTATGLDGDSNEIVVALMFAKYVLRFVAY